MNNSNLRKVGSVLQIFTLTLLGAMAVGNAFGQVSNTPPAAPSILSQPANKTIFVGGAVTFTVGAYGTQPLSHQWLFNNTNTIVGATGSSLTLTNIQPNQAGNYSVRVSNALGSILSSNAVLTVYAGDVSGVVVGWGNDLAGVNDIPPGLTNVMAIATGFYHSFALKNNGTVVVWGENSQGQTVPPANLSGVVAIAAGDFHNLALKSDGSVIGWGMNNYGQATPPVGLSNVVAIAAGCYHSLALKGDGTLVQWGSGNPPPSGLSGVVAIAAAQYYSLALKSDGTVVAWWRGSSSTSAASGQCNVPSGLTNVVAIAAGGQHCLALKSDGTVVGWGDNSQGQTAPPADLSGVVAIAAGHYTSIALKSDGTVVGWGWNNYGQATPPAGLGRVVAIAMHAWHNLALVNNIGAPVVAPPNSQTVFAGDTVTFLGFARGSQPLSYQWLFNDTNSIEGANGASLTLTNVHPNQAGNYSVLVTNAYGAVTSSNAVLTVVVSPPSVTSQPINRTVFAGNPTIFSVAAVGARPFSYQWRFNGIPIVGETDAWLTLTNVQPGDAGNYNVVVSNTFGWIVSSNATLTVTTPIITNSPIPLTTLTVLVNGSGTVKPPSGTPNLKPGLDYVITATPGPNTLFSNWLSVANGATNVASSAATYSFIMPGNLTLIANFVTNQFIGAVGSYYGLFSQTNEVTPQTAGFFKVKTTSRTGKPGSYSGSLILAGETIRYSGSFDVAGNVTIPLVFKSATVTLRLHLAADGSDTVTGTVSNDDGSWVARLDGNRAVFKASYPATAYAGRYTLAIPGSSDAAEAPEGDGYGMVKVASGGTISLVGSLGDGVGISQSVPVSKHGDWPFYRATSAATGTNAAAIIGWLSFNNGLSGTVTWIKSPAHTDTLYPQGFTNETDILASRYTVPATNNRAINLNNGTGIALLEGGNLGQCVSNQVTLSPQNKFTPGTNCGLTLTVTPKTGVLKGTFIHPTSSTTAKPCGVVLQEQNVGRGYFKGTNQSGALLLQGN